MLKLRARQLLGKLCDPSQSNYMPRHTESGASAALMVPQGQEADSMERTLLTGSLSGSITGRGRSGACLALLAEALMQLQLAAMA